VSAKLLTQFVECLEQTVLAEAPAADPEAAEPVAPAEPAADGTAAAKATPTPGVRTIEGPEAEPVDLLGTAGTPVAKRVGPVLAAIALVWLLKKLLTRKR